MSKILSYDVWVKKQGGRLFLDFDAIHRQVQSIEFIRLLKKHAKSGRLVSMKADQGEHGHEYLWLQVDNGKWLSFVIVPETEEKAEQLHFSVKPAKGVFKRMLILESGE